MKNWKLLEHFYGNASNIPELIAQLNEFPSEDDFESEPWYTLWNSLYHQGDLFSASFAAVPDIVNIIATAPEKVTLSFFLLPISIEIVRQKENYQIDEELLLAYEKAIADLASLAATTLAKNNNPAIRHAATAAFAVSAGLYQYAELLLEIPAENVGETIEWFIEKQETEE